MKWRFDHKHMAGCLTNIETGNNNERHVSNKDNILGIVKYRKRERMKKICNSSRSKTADLAFVSAASTLFKTI